MTLLLTLLSVLAVWALLVLLVFGLILIFKALDAIRRNLQQIAMGVRAIEQETSALAPEAEQMTRLAGETDAGLRALAGALETAVRGLDAALRPLGRRLERS